MSQPQKLPNSEPGPEAVIKNPDLHLVSTPDMIRELAARHPECFLIWCEAVDGDGTFERHRYDGCTSRCLGASERMYRHFLRVCDKKDN